MAAARGKDASRRDIMDEQKQVLFMQPEKSSGDVLWLLMQER